MGDTGHGSVTVCHRFLHVIEHKFTQCFLQRQCNCERYSERGCVSEFLTTGVFVTATVVNGLINSLHVAERHCYAKQNWKRVRL